jgi:hypothetical protein
MAGINGLALGFRSDANVRIYKFTALVKSTANTSNQQHRYAALPGASNAAGVLGVSVEHFVEPNYFVPEGTNPTTVTGTTPVLYDMEGRALTLQVNGVARCLAAGAVNQGDLLVIADAYGRVNNTANLSISAGTKVYPVGIAQNQTSDANDVVEVLLAFGQQVA